MAPDTSKLSAFERKRLENIKNNQALLRDLSSTADKLHRKPAPKKPASKSTTKRSVAVKREPILPTRTSSRLAGLKAEDGVEGDLPKRKLDDLLTTNDRPKRQRVSGDLELGNIVVAGKRWNQDLLSGINRGANPYERSFPEDGKLSDDAVDKDLTALRERISGLQLYEKFEPNQIKITPERVYSLAFHPTSTKTLIFAGDKAGNLGLFDASAQDDGNIGEDDEDEEEATPRITAFTLHPNTISSIIFGPNPEYLFTSSYDSSIRKLDLQKSVASEAYVAPLGEDVSVSCLDMVDSEPNILYFSTLTGYLGRHDMRTPHDTDFFQISEKKVGGFSLHPTCPHLVAAGSLDRSMRIWDLRKITKRDDYYEPHLVGEYNGRLSISHASWNSLGQVATSSYDDTVKIFSLESATELKAGKSLDEGELNPSAVIPHNNQTGRWVSILKPYWQKSPSDGVQKLVIGNMNRFVDIYSSSGEQLAQLGGDGIGQVPAVAKFHPTQNWVAGGTASGKLCLWM